MGFTFDKSRDISSRPCPAHRAWEHMQAGWRGVCIVRKSCCLVTSLQRDLEWGERSTAGGGREAGE